MLVHINNLSLKLSKEAEAKLLQVFFDHGREFYYKMPVEKQLIADQFARGLLYDAERKAVANGVDPIEAASRLRPDKNEDATMKFVDLLQQNAGIPLDHTELLIEVDDDYVITDIGYRINAEKS